LLVLKPINIWASPTNIGSICFDLDPSHIFIGGATSPMNILLK
jgi:hypothetical protein